MLLLLLCQKKVALKAQSRNLVHNKVKIIPTLAYQLKNDAFF